jgi:hypothetical protein
MGKNKIFHQLSVNVIRIYIDFKRYRALSNNKRMIRSIVYADWKVFNESHVIILSGLIHSKHCI